MSFAQQPVNHAIRRSSRFARRLLLVVFIGIASSHSLPAEDSLLKATAPFVSQYCADCHLDGAAEGGFDASKLSHDLTDEANFAQWERVFDRVESGEMPPEDSEQPTDAVKRSFIKRLGSPLWQTHAASKGTVLRRLNRREYQNTVNDLFGTNLKLEKRLPEDGRSHEFDNVGETLHISMVQLQQYMNAIDLVMDAAIAKTVEAPAPTKIVTNYAETREAKTHLGKSWKQLDDGAVVFYRTIGYPTGMLRTANTRKPGYYRIKVTGYAHQSDAPITFSIGGTTFARGAERPVFSWHQFQPGEPQSVEVVAWMEDRYMVEITPWNLHDTEYLFKKVGVEKYPGPGLAISEVELEGPLREQFPSRGHRLLFDGIERTEIEPSNPNQKTKSWYVPRFKITLSENHSEVTAGLQRVASAAFRRTVRKDEIGRYEKLFDDEHEAGATTEEAYRTAVAAIFCSPDFLFLREPSGKLDDHALATRLAYFLTRTSADEELSGDANTGQLRGTALLQKHVNRLLADERLERFVSDFSDAWLNLRDIEFTSPDRNLYPEFDQFLQQSSLQETRSFLKHLIDNNLPLRNIIRSDFAMLNNRLAMHYGIEGVDHPDVRPVQLPHESVRGGVLSMASVLKVSANGTNTSPVVRGVYVTERILGVHPSPPPPGVPGVEPDIRGASTLRELLDKHRDVESCRACHQTIDPPGFALECFNPIGGWRENFRSLGEGQKVTRLAQGRKVRYRIGPPVDASGELIGGNQFDGFEQFRDLLMQRERQIAKAFLTKLLTFATGREMGFSDRQEIERLVAKSETSDHRLADMIQLVVASPIFQTR
ncbi:MAG: DUF1592 domain-containing protein [Planctomycetota bacterium]